ncbi:MAG: 3-dehydroquinate synthase [Clostridia bacterium]|nr:3-dehydroquinate synthase [Clostridia bacterium]
MNINAGKYNIVIERGALSRVGELAKEAVKPCRAVIVSDDNVYPLYGKTVKNSLLSAGFTLGESYVFPHGEESKNWQTLGALIEHLAAEHLTRTDIVVALGGGVTGDMAGFASAVYLRGIRYIGLPTSLLASVDSSVGGKTAVDLTSGKNLVGAFHEPSLVVCDPDVLSTLPAEFFSDGMAEVIKTGLLGNEELWNKLGTNAPIDELIALCVRDKRDICERDLYDNGERQKLNLGHTIGHAIEAKSAFAIHHGHAVGAGLHAITKASVIRGLCDAELLTALDKILVRYDLDPYLFERFTAEELYEAAAHDKKTRGSSITLVIPRSVGHSELCKVPVSELYDYIKDGCTR